MAFLYCQRVGHQLMMTCLEHNFSRIISLFEHHSGIGPEENRIVSIHLIVDFIECDPVFYLIFISSEADFRKFHEIIYNFAVIKSAVFPCKMQRHFKMRKCDHRFNAVFEQFIKYIIIKLQPFLIRLFIVAVWKDSGPSDGCPETFHSHFRKEGNVLFIVMIKINGFVIRVEFSFFYRICDPSGNSVGSRCHDVHDARSLASFVPSAFKLVGSDGSAP